MADVLQCLWIKGVSSRAVQEPESTLSAPRADVSSNIKSAEGPSWRRGDLVPLRPERLERAASSVGVVGGEPPPDVDPKETNAELYQAEP